MRLPRSTTDVFLAALLTAEAASARARPDARGARSTLLSGTPRPDTLAPQKRTVDNADFVDNGGRTSDETARTQFSGTRATETGSERPTGTTGGIPLPLDPPAPPSQIGERAGAPSGAPTSEAIGRLARARCDREVVCNHVGNSRE